MKNLFLFLIISILLTLSCNQNLVKPVNYSVLMQFDSTSMQILQGTLYIDSTRIVDRRKSPVNAETVCICNCESNVAGPLINKDLIVRPDAGFGSCPTVGEDCRFRGAGGRFVSGKFNKPCNRVTTEHKVLVNEIPATGVKETKN
ncbi:MAG: hypothetical protein ACKV1O_11890 [Saprospiraceae bacterium]